MRGGLRASVGVDARNRGEYYRGKAKVPSDKAKPIGKSRLGMIPSKQEAKTPDLLSL